jgi:hypothetical protein
MGFGHPEALVLSLNGSIVSPLYLTMAYIVESRFEMFLPCGIHPQVGKTHWARSNQP